MRCPICEVNLLITERQGIEKDYCLKCRGVWLDRGELDKIIERATPGFGQSSIPGGAAFMPPNPNQNLTYPIQPNSYQYDDDNEPYSNKKHPFGRPKRRREGFLGELFDFD